LLKGYPQGDDQEGANGIGPVCLAEGAWLSKALYTSKEASDVACHPSTSFIESLLCATLSGRCSDKSIALDLQISSLDEYYYTINIFRETDTRSGM